jgi:hypothetical protein
MLPIAPSHVHLGRGERERREKRKGEEREEKGREK